MMMMQKQLLRRSLYIHALPFCLSKSKKGQEKGHGFSNASNHNIVKSI